jgi:hypothetical protein
MGMEFFTEKEVLAVNFGGTEIIGKFSSVFKDESTDISFIVLKNAVMILTQMTEKGLAHNMIDASENGNFADEIIVPAKNMSFIRRVSPLGDLYRKYLQITSKLIV